MANVNDEYEKLLRDLYAIKHAKSWQITRPFRYLGDFLRLLIRRINGQW